MIRVNLLGEQIDNSGLYFLQALMFGFCMVLTMGACFLTQQHMSSSLDLAQKEKRLLETRLSQLKQITKEVEGLEDKKKFLKEKLTTIASLKAKKHGPVQILDELNLAIPDRAWLEEIKEKDGVVTIRGIALDNQTISEFIRLIESSKHFGTVDLIHSTQSELEEVKIMEFSLAAMLVDPLKLRNAELKSGETAKQPEQPVVQPGKQPV